MGFWIQYGIGRVLPGGCAFFAFSIFPLATGSDSLQDTYLFYRAFRAGFVFLGGQRDRQARPRQVDQES